MICYRLSKQEYAQDLSGKGAEKSGGRWNSKGVSVLYTAESRALCALELAVHLPFGIIPKDYCMTQISFPCNNNLIQQIPFDSLFKEWNSIPHTHHTQEIGNQFIKENKCLILKVPSAIVDQEFNYLINPDHPKIKEVKVLSVDTFSFDQRLFRT